MTSTNPNLSKTIDRFNSKIASGDYYEAHQTLRTIANRYVRGGKWYEATNLIFHAAESFLKAKKGSAGIDLIFYLLEVYDLAKIKVEESTISKLVQLLVLVDSKEPNLKDVITGMNNWSIKYGSYNFGDPYLHSIIGAKLMKGGYIYECERYLVLGTHDSMKQYLELIWNWFEQSNDVNSVGDFFSRLIFNYLFIFNLQYAFECREGFLSKFIDKYQPKHEVLNKNNFEMIYFPDFIELNFLQLLLIICQTKNKDLFNNLKAQYQFENKFSQELEFIGQEYFGITIQKPVNFLQDMMSGIFGGK